jgi:N-acyl-D-aspartate/D-glutamate deacylase
LPILPGLTGIIGIRRTGEMYVTRGSPLKTLRVYRSLLDVQGFTHKTVVVASDRSSRANSLRMLESELRTERRQQM